eukprot:TRINITY_DN294_c0_g2_i1.p1 TRINITY_DN294_c0_g2~~TRINITY_DN294_c0_g2_i1.p1  ORF type:complete len:387 (+),score=55.23 TRINITY_DN294_c0_g2_i1:180-1340(+)
MASNIRKTKQIKLRDRSFLEILFVGCCLSIISICILILIKQPQDEEILGFVQNGMDMIKRQYYTPEIGDVDVVFTYVNGSHSIMDDLVGKRDVSRFRDNDELKFSLRSIDKYLPWIRDVYLVVMDKRIAPSWLNQTRVKIITHDEIFTDKTALPTFNSNGIESNLGNLKHNVSDPFLYFNDDYFLGKPILPQDFFTRDGTGRLYFESGTVYEGKYYDELVEINKQLWVATVTKSAKMMDSLGKVKTRHYVKHAPHVISQKIFQELENLFPDEFERNEHDKFRSFHDFCPMHLYMWYAAEKKNYEEVSWLESDGSARLITVNDKKMTESMRLIRGISRPSLVGLRPRFFTINDNGPRSEKLQRAILTELMMMFPEKSSYEKSDNDGK